MAAELWFSNDEKMTTCQIIYREGLFNLFLQDGREYAFDEGDPGLERFLVKEGFLTLREIRAI